MRLRSAVGDRLVKLAVRIAHWRVTTMYSCAVCGRWQDSQSVESHPYCCGLTPIERGRDAIFVDRRPL